MAGDAVVGALRVVLGMDTAAFEDGAKTASNRIASFGTQMKAVFAGVGLEHIVERVFDTIVHQFKEGITHALHFADEMGKTAQKVGVSVEELSSLNLAAGIADVSMETLSKSLGLLSKNMATAAEKNGEMRDEFKKLGINVRDSEGNIKSVITVLGEMADKFSHTEDGVFKTDAALKLLGRGGKELIPLLNEGKISLEEFTKIARNMGLEISTKTAKDAEHFNDNLKILALTKQGLANIVTEALLPALIRLSDQFVEGAKTGTLVRDTADKIITVIKETVLFIARFIEADKLLGQAFKELQNAAVAAWDGILEIINKVVDIAAKAIELLIATIRKIPFVWVIEQAQKLGGAIFTWVVDAIGKLVSTLPEGSKEMETFGKLFAQIQSLFTSDKFAQAAESWAKMKEEIAKIAPNMAALIPLIDAFFAAITTGASHAKKSTENVIDEGLKKELERLALQTAVLKGNFDQLAPGLPEIAARLGLIDASGKGLTNSLSTLTPALILLNAELQKFLMAKVTEEMLAPWDQFDQKMQILKASFSAVGQESDAFKNKSLKNLAELNVAYGLAAEAVVGPMASAFKTLAGMNKKYAGAAKALAIGEAIINTYVAANKAYAAFAYAPPLAIAAAAAAVAAGLANVAKISATEFATGGSFKVGGVGGIDSQTIAMNLTPGEMVDVRKPGQQTTTQEITVNMRGRDLISKDMVRDLFAALNEGTRDGYRLKMAEG